MHPMVAYLRKEMRKRADPVKAAQMQAYMKTEQRFYGVQTPQREAVFAAAAGRFPLGSRKEYESVVRALWKGPCREDMYLALDVAERYRRYRDETAWSLYEDLVRSAPHWDTLDRLATRLIGPLLLQHPRFERRLRKWVASDNLWVRRAALLAGLKHKEQTNTDLLAEFILILAPEKAFFIRKAIGWALREYSRTDPVWVERFVEDHGENLSALSKREALRWIRKRGTRA
jgi:3-methyladenine DNA glycosylase AlkD